jgi:hypothetical protein
MPNNTSLPRSRGNALPTAPLVLALALACARGGAAPGAAADTTAGVVVTDTTPFAAARPGVPPAALTGVGTYGEDLYDQTKASDWTLARAAMDSLRGAAQTLSPGDVRVESERTALVAVVDTLGRAIAAHDRVAAMRAANEVTRLAATMTDVYRPATPTQVSLLDYYGRELEIWSARGDQGRLSQTAAAIRGTWQSLKPAVEARQGTLIAEQTDSIVSRIAAARTTRDYARLATPLLDDVDQLEAVFTTP